MAEKKSLQLTPMGGDPLLGMVRTSIMRGEPALGYMERYRRLVSSAARGAILE